VGAPFLFSAKFTYVFLFSLFMGSPSYSLGAQRLAERIPVGAPFLFSAKFTYVFLFSLFMGSPSYSLGAQLLAERIPVGAPFLLLLSLPKFLSLAYLWVRPATRWVLSV